MSESPFQEINTREISVLYPDVKDGVSAKNIGETACKTVKKNLKKAKLSKPLKVKDVVLQVEPYDYDKCPDKRGLVQVHALFVLSRALNLSNHKRWVKKLTFDIEGKSFAPHASKFKTHKDFIEHVTEMHNADDKYGDCAYYFRYDRSSYEHIDDMLEEMLVKKELHPEDLISAINEIGKIPARFRKKYIHDLKMIRTIVEMSDMIRMRSLESSAVGKNEAKPKRF